VFQFKLTHVKTRDNIYICFIYRLFEIGIQLVGEYRPIYCLVKFQFKGTCMGRFLS